LNKNYFGIFLKSISTRRVYDQFHASSIPPISVLAIPADHPHQYLAILINVLKTNVGIRK